MQRELDFRMMKCKFAFRLRNRGYLPSFYRRIMDKVKWCDRAKHCTINQPNTTIPLIFRLTYCNNFMEGKRIRNALLKHWNALPAHLQTNEPILCWKAQRKLKLYATKADHQKFNEDEENPKKKIKFTSSPISTRK